MIASTTIINPNKRPIMQIPETLPTLDTTNPAPLLIMEITDRKTLLHKTIYHAKQLKTDHLTAKQLCQHIDSGFKPEHLTRIHSDDEDTPILDIPFQATWKATWISEDTARSLPNGNTAIHNYNLSKLPPKKKLERPHLPRPIDNAAGSPATQPIPRTPSIPT